MANSSLWRQCFVPCLVLAALATPAAMARAQSSTPLSGSPAAMPGTVQAEAFDNGGQGVAYFDNSTGNKGGAYRATDVDIEGTADSGGGFNLGWMSSGEWLHYTVNVATAGSYTLELRVASPTGGGTFHVEFGGVNKTGTLTMPTTGGWQNWTTVSKTVTLSAGTQVMRVVVGATASNGTFGNLNWIRTTGATTAPPPAGSTPFTGTPVALPGTMQAESFDNGGQNVAYRDMSGGNSGGAYRVTDVDIEGTADTGGGFNLGWMSAGEWLQYTVNVASAGTYTLELRVASPTGGGTFHVEFGGTNKTGTMTMPTTGGWQSWTTVSKTVTLSAGTQVMRLVVDTTASNGTFGNLNWLRVVSGGSEPPPPPPPPSGSTPFTGTPAPLPGLVQVENFDNGGAEVAYHDNGAGNKGGAYRNTDVDIESTADTGGGFDIGWTSAGEWLNYTVNVPTAGTYTLQVRVASPVAGATFHVEFDGVDRTGAIVIPNTGGWQTWTTLSTTVNLSAGTQIMRIVLDSNAPGGGFGNMNWIRVQ